MVWEKFCRYFDVEPRIVPLAEGKYTIGPEDVAPHLDENTIGVGAVLGTTFTGHMDDIVGINRLLLDLKTEQGLDIPIHVDGASGAFVWPFLYPDSAWDFRLEQVRSINVSGHKYGLVYPGHRLAGLPRAVRPGRGPRLLRELPGQDRRDVHPELLHRRLDGARAVLQLRPARPRGLHLRDASRCSRTPGRWRTNLRQSGRFEVIGDDLEQLPLVAFRLKGEHAGYDESDIAWQLSAERGWMVPAYTLPPNAEDVKIMRALVKETMSREQVDRLTQDIEDACATLDPKGGATPRSAPRSSRAPATEDGPPPAQETRPGLGPPRGGVLGRCGGSPGCFMRSG